MADVAVESELYRLTAEQYHVLIESGTFDEKSRVEFIDGVIVEMRPKSPEHESIIRWLLRQLFATVDQDRYEIGASSALSLGESEPEPDLLVIAKKAERPYHPATAELVVEVAVSSRTRDLKVKPRLYAGAGVPVYWVIDVERARAVQHTQPQGDEYGRVEIVTELTAPHLGIDPIAVADVLRAAR
jgi:Uma2 family endonuclease